jgi:hypothetical protein
MARRHKYWECQRERCSSSRFGGGWWSSEDCIEHMVDVNIVRDLVLWRLTRSGPRLRLSLWVLGK